MDQYQTAANISDRWFYIQSNIVSSRKVSIKYYKYRIGRPLLKLYNRMLVGNPKDKPWLAPAAIEILENLDLSQKTGLEFGSGNSTRFLAARLSKLVSFEHSPEWYDIVKGSLGGFDVDYRLIQPSEVESKKSIESRYSNPFVTEEELYKDYYLGVQEFEDESFDLILIDGRARVECAKYSIPKLNKGGIFILDNSERERYKEILKYIPEWPRIVTTTGLTDTSFWFKPS